MRSRFPRELRHALRSLAANPGFTGVAILSLALGIGANVAMVGAVRALILDRLPLPNPDQLVHIAWSEPAGRLPISQINSSRYHDPETGASHRSNFTVAQTRALTSAASDLLDLTTYNFVREVSVGLPHAPPVITGGVLVNGRYFDVLRLAVMLGRPLGDTDDRPGAPPVAVISHQFWMRLFGGSPDAIGQQIRVNGIPVEVVGVSAAEFRGLSRGGFFPETAITLPLQLQPLVAPQFARGLDNPRGLFAAEQIYWLRLMGRHRPDVSSAAIRAALTPAFQRLLPDEARTLSPIPTIQVVPGARAQPIVTREHRPLLILAAVAAVVLLVACLNVAALLLSRGVARQRDLAVRRAMGATRGRLVRELLLESGVLAAGGAATGALFAIWGRGALGALLTASLGTSGFGEMRIELAVDWLMVIAAGAVALVTTMLCGVLPAVRLSQVDSASMLKHRTAGGGTRTFTLGRGLLVLQIAVSVPLIVGAFVFLRTIGNLSSVDLGFDPRGVAFFRLNPDYAALPAERHAELYLDVLRRLETVPGVQSATLIENALMTGITSSNRVTIDGVEHGTLMNAVGPRFFEVMGMRVVSGRAPDASDRPGRPDVAAVNEAFVQELFGGRSPIGRVVRVGARDIQIVGVVTNSRYTQPRAGLRPVLFDSALQRSGTSGRHVMIRTTGAPALLEPAVRRAVADVHPDLPVPELRTQTAQIEIANARERVFAQVLSLFAAFALLLAGIGLHGVTAYSVARRTNEIGVRVAVGAAPGRIIGMIMRQVALLAAAGIMLGAASVLALGPVVQSLLFEVVPHDAFLMAAGSSLLLLVAALAGALPAWAAARLNPVAALRVE